MTMKEERPSGTSGGPAVPNTGTMPSRAAGGSGSSTRSTGLGSGANGAMSGKAWLLGGEGVSPTSFMRFDQFSGPSCWISSKAPVCPNWPAMCRGVFPWTSNPLWGSACSPPACQRSSRNTSVWPRHAAKCIAFHLRPAGSQNHLATPTQKRASPTALRSGEAPCAGARRCRQSSAWPPTAACISGVMPEMSSSFRSNWN
mmetsp:Transcript_112110/g.297972  ORF Transcript_112110/g.297972 Transcript_112110/m.297972 type:complete len:200 (+) Transcript_112110:1090-1689(+)